MAVALWTVGPALAAEDLADLDARLDRLIATSAELPPAAIGVARPAVVLFADHDCIWCLRSVPTFEALRVKFGAVADVIVIDPIRGDPRSRLLAARYGVWSLPMIVAIARGGRVAQKVYGEPSAEGLHAAMQRLVEQSATSSGSRGPGRARQP
jgi:hypothetical protein